jgi:hypothetical protein
MLLPPSQAPKGTGSVQSALFSYVPYILTYTSDNDDANVLMPAKLLGLPYVGHILIFSGAIFEASRHRITLEIDGTYCHLNENSKL